MEVKTKFNANDRCWVLNEEGDAVEIIIAEVRITAFANYGSVSGPIIGYRATTLKKSEQIWFAEDECYTCLDDVLLKKQSQ